jgi:hypothetical protein
MSKIFGALTAIFVLCIMTVAGPAGAEGIRNVDQPEVRAERRCVRMPPRSFRPYCYYYYPSYQTDSYYHRPYDWTWWPFR